MAQPMPRQAYSTHEETPEPEIDKSLPRHDQAARFCEIYKLTNFTIDPETGVIDVNGDVDLSFGFRESIPVQFGKVTGNFDCHCTKLTSLKGAPYFVGGYFDCGATSITSLEYAPQTVNGSFLCWRTHITSLKGSPRRIGGDFVCDNTDLTSLEGLPDSIRGYINLSNNKITDYGILDLLYVSNLKYIYFDDDKDKTSVPGPSYGDGLISKILNKAHTSRDIATAQKKLKLFGFEKLADFSMEFIAKEEKHEQEVQERARLNAERIANSPPLPWD